MGNIMTVTQEAKVDALIERTSTAADYLEDVAANLKTNVSVDTATGIAQHNNDTNAHTGIVSFIRDELRAEVERLSGGRNTIIRDAQGDPHHMVVIPCFNVQDIDPSLGTGIHPAFIVGGVRKAEIFMGKYLASNTGGKAKTLARKAPWVSINFDNALAAARACGAGFGMATNAMYAARALWLMKERGGVEYLGNTSWGRSHSKLHQAATMQTVTFGPGDTGNNITAATLTGTGPDSWNDDGTPYGVSDLVGNVWEWASGLRVNNGEIQITPNNDSMLPHVDHSPASSAWKAIMPDGSLVAPGTAGTLKINHNTSGAGAIPNICTNITHVAEQVPIDWERQAYCAFKDLTSDGNVPAILKALGMCPVGTAGVQGALWTLNYGERLPVRGGPWYDGGYCGPFALYLSYQRTNTRWHIGFRAAFA